MSAAFAAANTAPIARALRGLVENTTNRQQSSNRSGWHKNNKIECYAKNLKLSSLISLWENKSGAAQTKNEALVESHFLKFAMISMAGGAQWQKGAAVSKTGRFLKEGGWFGKHPLWKEPRIIATGRRGVVGGAFDTPASTNPDARRGRAEARPSGRDMFLHFRDARHDERQSNRTDSLHQPKIRRDYSNRNYE
jgi:hypothetical protein